MMVVFSQAVQYPLPCRVSKKKKNKETGKPSVPILITRIVGVFRHFA